MSLCISQYPNLYILAMSPDPKAILYFCTFEWWKHNPMGYFPPSQILNGIYLKNRRWVSGAVLGAATQRWMTHKPCSRDPNLNSWPFSSETTDCLNFSPKLKSWPHIWLVLHAYFSYWYIFILGSFFSLKLLSCPSIPLCFHDLLSQC